MKETEEEEAEACWDMEGRKMGGLIQYLNYNGTPLFTAEEMCCPSNPLFNTVFIFFLCDL
jgi:hypothetical protein